MPPGRNRKPIRARREDRRNEHLVGDSVDGGAGMANHEDDAGADSGYDFSQFPTGSLPSGGAGPAFQMMDNKAFYESGLRGMNRTNFPFNESTGVADSNALAGGFDVNNADPGNVADLSQVQVSSGILDEFASGVSTLTSTGNAIRPRGLANYSNDNDNNDDENGYHSIEDQYRGSSGLGPQQNGIPFAPFAYSYPNFGTSDGQPDYGFDEPGSSSISQSILDQHAKMMATSASMDAGFQKDLEPIFSGTNILVLEQRPIFQSKGRLKGTMWRNGQSELPDDLMIDPKSVLESGSNIPVDMFSTNAELMSILNYMGYDDNSDGLSSTTGYGKGLSQSKMMGAHPGKMEASLYEYDTTGIVSEPLIFASRNRYPHLMGAQGRDRKYLQKQ